MRQLAWMLLAGLLVVTSGSLAAQQASPDMILNNGKIITVDDRFSIAQAIAIRGDRIVAADARVMGADVLEVRDNPPRALLESPLVVAPRAPKPTALLQHPLVRELRAPMPNPPSPKPVRLKLPAFSPTNVLALSNL